MGVSEQAATTLALIIHELATNSVKYGALSVDNGLLDISCAAEESQVTLVWTECGGPPVKAPEAGGFGAGLLERSMRSKFRGSIEYDWAPDGVVITLRMQKDRLSS